MSGAEDIRVEVNGLSCFGPHGVTEAEREAGCRILLDIALDVPASEAVASDELAGTVDYGAVARLAFAFVAERSFHTLERLCGALADELEAEFGAEGLEITATKPEPPMPLEVEGVSVTLVRDAPAAE